jgi:hypothetical protein
MTENKYVYALNRGWDAANYAEAYGEEIVNHYKNTDYEAAFALGVERYQVGLWQDGSPRD